MGSSKMRDDFSIAFCSTSSKTVGEIVERVAEAIYRTSGGMTDEDFVQIHGKARRIWKTDQPWDSQSDIELCEWERDEYRLQAQAVINVLGHEYVQILQGDLS